jgi:tRNA(fMet)-specific endonuclease VapC
LIDSIVVDTDVVSFLFKADSRADLYRPHLEGKIAAISFMTVAETNRWVLERNWGESRKRKLEAFLGSFVVIESNPIMCLKWAEAMHSARRNGRPISTADAWIAAAALLQSMPLVTHNRTHYSGVSNLQVVSEAP